MQHFLFFNISGVGVMGILFKKAIQRFIHADLLLVFGWRQRTYTQIPTYLLRFSISLQSKTRPISILSYSQYWCERLSCVHSFYVPIYIIWIIKLKIILSDNFYLV